MTLIAYSTLGGGKITIYHLDLIMCAFGLIALFGYAYKKRILNIAFWKVFAPCFVIWSAYFFLHENFIFSDGKSIEPNFVIALIVLAICIPGYIGPFLYGYRSIELWNEEKRV